jgi:hypothetical protein
MEVSKSFRWKGPGVFTDFINGKAFQAGEGQIVHEHTVAPEKLAQWVKDGIAEFVNVVENIADRIGGQKPDDEDTKRLQAAHDQVNATLRIKVLGELRLLLLDRAFTDAERSDAERDIETTGIEDLQRALESTQAEHKRRLSIASTPATPPAPVMPPEPSTGADDADRLSEEDMERLTNPAGEGAGPK